ncbi:MAG: S41 family peptidase [Desulfomonilaceae bacterium]|nr:S41 family peptidase [Desulfomonilaceae bacterium]
MLKPLRMLLVSGILPMLAFTSNSIAIDGSIRDRGHNEVAVSRKLAQRSLDSGREYGHGAAGATFRGSSGKLFEKVMSLIDSEYPEPVSEKDLLEHAMLRLTLTILPQCMEGVPSLEECSRPFRRCFLNAVGAVASNCGLDRDRLLMYTLRMLLRDLDPNSALLDSTLIKELKISTSGKFGGVGMVVSPKDGDYVVVSPFDGSPAFKAGIKSGDTIMEIDGKPLHGMPLVEVLQLVRGPAGSGMSLTIRDEKTGRVGRLKLRRLVISVPPVRRTMLSDDIGYLRIVNFQHDTAAHVKKALEKMFDFEEGGVKGLILDLRDNPGGLFGEAIAVADLFVPSGVITSVRGRTRESYTEFKARGAGTYPEVPMVVLINRGAASASEILAAALQSRPNVLVMGEKSFGKASVQAVFPLGNGMALRLTTAHYYTPDGKDIHGKGLEPDIETASPQGITRARMGDSDLRTVADDPEVAKAVTYLKRDDHLRESLFPSLY